MGDRGRDARRWPAVMVAGGELGVVVKFVLGSLHAAIGMVAGGDVEVRDRGAISWCLVFACGVGDGASRLHRIAASGAGAEC